MPQLTPTPKFAVRTDTGDPAVGWKLWTYLENTSTPKDTYADFGKVGTNTNPIILDSRGEAEIWLDGSYKFVLTDDLDQTIWTIDNIRDQTQNQTLTNATLAGTLTVSSTAVTWSGNPTHSGNHTFGGNVTVNGNTQLGNASSDTLRIDSNTITWTNNPTHSGDHTFSGDVSISGDTTIGDALGDTLIVAGGALKIFSDGRLSGNKLHNVGAVTGASDQFIASGTYSPTFTLVSNVSAASSSIAFQWMRVGNVCTVSGRMFADPVGAALTQVGITLPVASSLTDGEQCSGTAARVATLVGLAGYIFGDPGNARAELNFLNDADTALRSWAVHFTYLIL